MTKEQARPGMRIEEDALGNVEVPADHLWGAQTQRSHLNFPIGVERFHWRRAVIRALGILKKCAALANGELGQLPKDKVDLIVKAAQEVIDGTWDSEFPLVVFQTGSGTQTNMNANEVIANRAIQIAGGVVGSKKPVHPNDHVNHSQSSNDTFPTVMHIAAVEEMLNNLLPAVKELRETLAAKSKAYADVVMVGRTHLQDATPLTLGQVISGWVGQLDHAIAVLERAIEGMYALAIGGTAVGTGLNADKPVMLHNVLESAQLLAEAVASFNERCACGIEPNVKRIRQHLDNSLMLVTALNPHIGYEKAAQISLLAYREDLSLKDAALKLGYLTAEEFDQWVRPAEMTHPLTK